MRLVPVVLLAMTAHVWAQAAGEGSGTGAGSGSGESAAPGEATPPPPVAPPPPITFEKPAHSIDTPPPGTDTVRDVLRVMPSRPDAGFRFGSYGRVSAGSDLRGGKPERIAVVAHPPRIVEPSYLELELSYGFQRHDGAGAVLGDIVIRPIITLAFDATLFHETGQFDAHPALRNMFVEARAGRRVTLWAGSRMYRGDDIYLFDYWPLDDINTVGGGVQYSLPVGVNHLDVAAHAGENRVQNPFQFQQIEAANPAQGATTITQLNRQRMIASATGAFIFEPRGDHGRGLKLKLHTEFHSLPSGTRARCDANGINCMGTEALPSDTGFLVGAEASAFEAPHDGYRRHLNVFARYAKGLAAFDELAPPTSFGTDLKTQHASELTFGLSGNYDHARGNLMIGALSRRFVDADQNSTDPDDGWEYAIDARPLVRLAPDWFVGADISYQARFPRGINPITETAEDPAVFEIAPTAVFSPLGPSSYDRPQLRFVYRAAHLNQGALDLYVPGDERAGHAWVHFLGVQAEWWFNSSTYH
jgi:hypothetical protein